MATGIGYEGHDYNEMNDICSPQLRAIDGINPMDPTLASAREAGVTCVCTGPGQCQCTGRNLYRDQNRRPPRRRYDREG